MTNTTTIKENDYQCLQQAAQWFAIFADGEVSDQEQQEFMQWLKSKDNQQAWSFVDGVSQNFTNVRDSKHHDLALNALGNINPNQTRRNTLKILSLLPLSVLFSWVGYKHTRFGPVIQASLAGYINDYATDIGDISHINLADNSQVSLNTASAINVKYDNNLRLIDLVRGEILITTSKDARRFEVNTVVARLRALGTRFNVRQFSDNKVQLSVFEGSVSIYQGKNWQEGMANQYPFNQKSLNQEHIVKAGQQVMIIHDTIHTLAPVTDKQSSWQQGLLFANEIPLEEFIEQVARYRKGYLAVSPDVANLRIMGSFPLNDTDKILTMLSNSLPIKVNNILPWWQTIEAK
jgi:transmembrane sensor